MALKKISESFDIDSEEELRFAIASFFEDLGFKLDEMSFEDHFTIQIGRTVYRLDRHNRQHEGSARGYSDILLTRGGKPLAIIEVKSPEHGLTESDAWQAISYARLLKRQIAPFAVVTNGQNTRVYDPLAESDTLVELSSPQQAQWHKHGQSMWSIGDDLRQYAAKQLVSINRNTLEEFCRSQVREYGIVDLKGGSNEFRPYIPSLYVPRQGLESAFQAWLEDDSLPCFAVIGQSGIGKTNFMCFTAERLLSEHFVLFYSGSRMPRQGISAAIQLDFSWEFRRSSSIAQIVERFDDLSEAHGKRFFVFIDALDEFIGEQVELRAELLHFTQRLESTRVRVCVSCKPSDWERFVLDHMRSFNRIAHLTYPQAPEVKAPHSREDVSARNVGYWLGTLSDGELSQAFEKYKAVYNLRGELRGETRSESSLPFILRLVAEVYANQDAELANELSSIELFDSLWQRKLTLVDDDISAGRILAALASEQVLHDKRFVAEHQLVDIVKPDRLDRTYRDLIRVGILEVREAAHGTREVGIGFEKLRNYVFVVHTMCWSSKSPEIVAREIVEFLNAPSQSTLEAIDFYISVVDRGETSVLVSLALEDLRLFIRLLEPGARWTRFEVPIAELIGEARHHAPLSRLEQYAVTYSELSHHYFPHFCQRIVPYTREAVGLWVSEEPHLRFQFRAVTAEYPQRVVVYPPGLVRDLRLRQVPNRTLKAIGDPHGVIQVGMSELSTRLAQDVAWERLVAQLAEVLDKGLLDESNSPEITQERVIEVLLREPYYWVPGAPSGRRNFQLFGFEKAEAIFEVSLGELQDRISGSLNDIIQGAQQAQSPGLRQWYQNRLSHWVLLKRWLRDLSNHQSSLEKPLFDLPTIFTAIRNPDAAARIFELLTPVIIQAYRSMIERNFPKLCDYFALYKNGNASILVEVTHENSILSSDFVEIRYVVLPSVEVGDSHRVYTRERNRSLAQVAQNLGESIMGFRSEGFGFGFGSMELSLDLGDEHIDEPKAFVYRTRFPSRAPITSQVYQLIRVESEQLFGGDRMDWSALDEPRFDLQHLAWILAREGVNTLDAHLGTQT